MSGSAIRQIVPALVTLFTGAGVAGLQVVDGPIWEPKTNHLAVGWSPVNQAPIQVRRRQSDVALRLARESCDVACLLSYRRGNSTIPQVRAELLDGFDLLDSALNADPKLGGAAALADISEYAIQPEIYETGEWVAMTFTVHAETWR